MRISRIGVTALASATAVGLLASPLMLSPGMAAEEETAGNNLAVPVLWSEDGYTVALRGAMDAPTLTGATAPCSEMASTTAALQQEESNTWQADNLLAAGNQVTTVDWGDNLESKDWRVGQMLRVETGLYSDVSSAPMTGYEMCYVSGSGQTEKWGAVLGSSGDAVTYESPEAMVYTAGARLTIQRIDADATPVWDPVTHQWTGAGVATPVYNGALHEGTTGGTNSFGAEINVSGKLVYGFIWQTSGLFNGEYRLTFSLDDAIDAFPGSGTSLATASIRTSTEAATLAMGPGGGMGGGGMGGGGHGGGGGGGEDEGSGNTAVVVPGSELTYIDVALSGGEDPPTVEPTPTPSPTTPPSDGGASIPGPGPTAGPGPAAGPGPTAGPAGDVPVFVASPGDQIRERSRQRARLRATAQVWHRVGGVIVLTTRPVRTDYGVTVRWRVQKQDRENCQVQSRSGRVTLRFNDEGVCRVIAWAPSPDVANVAPYRETRTYRVRGN